MTIVSIGLRAEAERILNTRAAQGRAVSRISSGEDPFDVYMQERVIEYMSQPALEDVALPRPQRDDTPVEVVLVQRYVE